MELIFSTSLRTPPGIDEDIILIPKFVDCRATTVNKLGVGSGQGLGVCSAEVERFELTRRA
jgi:hypothetical protein